MKKFITKMILVSFVLSLTVVMQASIINVYEWNDVLANLSIQPQANDLAQSAGSTKYITAGALHSASDVLDSMFNSNVDGSYGPHSPEFRAIFRDGVSPGADTTFRCDFDIPKEIAEVHVFSFWGDRRLFTWFEVWISTNNSDYTHVGTATFGESGDPCTNYVSEHCLARLYDPDDGVIATNVTSVKFVQKNCGYDGGGIPGGIKLDPGTITNDFYTRASGSVIYELDIIKVPEPTTITNEYFWENNLENLPFQPQCDDLAQLSGSTNYIVAGGMHTYEEFISNKFEFLFNSPVDGELGAGEPLTVGGTGVLLWDAPIPSPLTLEWNCDFDSPKIVQAVQVFSRAGDPRLFTYGEVYYSTTGTDADDYTYIGAVSFGEWGESSDGYADYNCVARLYDTVPDGSLADDVTSIKIRFLGVMDTTWVDLTHKVEGSSGGSTIGEVDIIGIPEPATFLVGCFLLGLAFLRRR